MVRSVSKKLVFLFAVNITLCSLIFMTANGLSVFTSNARESFITGRIAVIEESIYSIELGEYSKEELQNNIYNAYAGIDYVNTLLKEYHASEMINPNFYTEQEQKLITLSTLLLKTIKTEFSDKNIIYFYCESHNSECDYEAFVLSYISNKYRDNIFVIGFDSLSNHPLVRMMMKKYSVDSVPFMVVNDFIVRGFKNAKEMEAIVLNENSNLTA